MTLRNFSYVLVGGSATPLQNPVETHQDNQLDWISGWWYTNPSEKYVSQLGFFIPYDSQGIGKSNMFQTTKQKKHIWAQSTKKQELH